MAPSDGHGRNILKCTDEREKIIKHIKHFPVKATQYWRKGTNKRYLHEKLTIGKMHKLYEKWCEEKGYKDRIGESKQSLTIQSANLKINSTYTQSISDRV